MKFLFLARKLIHSHSCSPSKEFVSISTYSYPICIHHRSLSISFFSFKQVDFHFSTLPPAWWSSLHLFLDVLSAQVNRPHDLVQAGVVTPCTMLSSVTASLPGGYISKAQPSDVKCSLSFTQLTIRFGVLICEQSKVVSDSGPGWYVTQHAKSLRREFVCNIGISGRSSKSTFAGAP